MLAIGLALFFGSNTVAWALEGLLLAALGALIFGRFCIGSYLYYMFTGEMRFANRTLPWGRTD